MAAAVPSWRPHEPSVDLPVSMFTTTRVWASSIVNELINLLVCMPRSLKTGLLTEPGARY